MRSVCCTLFLTAILVSAATTPSSATAAQTQPAETATQFYLRWRTTVLSATSVDAITGFWTADTVHEFKMEPESVRAETLPMLKRFYGTQTDVKVVKETVTPTGATLSLEAIDGAHQPIVSSVDVFKEDGAWKIGNAVEQWKPKGHD